MRDNLDSNLSLPWSLMRLLALCRVVPTDRAHSLGTMTSPYSFDGNLVTRSLLNILTFLSMNLDLRALSSRTKFWCQHSFDYDFLSFDNCLRSTVYLPFFLSTLWNLHVFHFFLFFGYFESFICLSFF